MNLTTVQIKKPDPINFVLGQTHFSVIDGFPPKGLEAEPDIAWRKGFLRQIGYKL